MKKSPICSQKRGERWPQNPIILFCYFSVEDDCGLWGVPAGLLFPFPLDGFPSLGPFDPFNSIVLYLALPDCLPRYSWLNFLLARLFTPFFLSSLLHNSGVNYLGMHPSKCKCEECLCVQGPTYVSRKMVKICNLFSGQGISMADVLWMCTSLKLAVGPDK